MVTVVLVGCLAKVIRVECLKRSALGVFFLIFILFFAFYLNAMRAFFCIMIFTYAFQISVIIITQGTMQFDIIQKLEAKFVVHT